MSHLPRRIGLAGAATVATLAVALAPASATQPLCLAPPPESEPNGTSGQANLLISPCYARVGAISPANDADWYRIGAINGGRLWLLVDTGSPPAQSASRDSVLELYDSDGTTLIEMDDDDGLGNGGDGTVETGLASLIAGRRMFLTDNYYLKVRQFGSLLIDGYHLLTNHTTDWMVSPEVEPNDDAAAAGPVDLISKVFTAAIGAADDVDVYSFVARAGEEVFVAADGDPERDTVNTDIDIELLDTDGSIVLLLADSSTGSGIHEAEGFRFVVPASGRYYARVFGADGTVTGTYDLMIWGQTDLFHHGFDAGVTTGWSATVP